MTERNDGFDHVANLALLQRMVGLWGQKRDIEMVLVPRKPTPEMIEAAFCACADENAEGVWGAMIEAWQKAKTAASSDPRHAEPTPKP